MVLVYDWLLSGDLCGRATPEKGDGRISATKAAMG
jgi:hypothetical protein